MKKQIKYTGGFVQSKTAFLTGSENMLEYFKDLKLIYSFSRVIKALTFIRTLLTVVIIAFSVITGARLFITPEKTE